MATLANKIILIFGGSSGIGFGVAEASLKSDAATVIIVSSNEERVQGAVKKLKDGKFGSGEVKGLSVDVKDEAALKKLLTDVGAVDHIVWSAGDGLPLGFPNMELDFMKSTFDVRFWGAVIVAQNAKFRVGGSFILTTGTVIVKPGKTWSMAAAIMGAVDSFTRGLALDLAPIRVNSVCPGFIKTELWKDFAPDQLEKLFADTAEKLPVKHVAGPDEVAEAYMFLMKCAYITGQKIQVDGGHTLAA
ncbi:hypothetical protein M422DRAFT_35503 [Sphaerobolus stellatus SS14]|uniref:NAD(P)-binding protein n=1 Tax=Sphaerobolus stellatus (strain SS14) TaxID=990650 RepID=A0A0C9TSW0_SPHS4|nr:hypothetical protein M422DRAFT_35503 [Sphaerobolus stellatus SS14]